MQKILDKKISHELFLKELETIKPRKINFLFWISFVIALCFFSYLGYLILTKNPPTSEKNFFDSIGVEYNKTAE